MSLYRYRPATCHLKDIANTELYWLGTKVYIMFRVQNVSDRVSLSILSHNTSTLS